MKESIISVIGTIAGTVLGWALNSFSKRGKLSIGISSWNESVLKKDKYGGYVPCSTREDAEYYCCYFDLNFYNSSADVKSLRAIKLFYYDKSERLVSLDVYDNDTRHNSGGRLVYDDLNTINIPAKHAVVIHAISHISRFDTSFNTLWKGSRVYFTYKDEKNRLNKVFITELKYDWLQ